MQTALPGTLWINRGRWNWRVKLPGDTKRKNYPLYWNNQKVALAEEKGRSLAESLAWRLWNKANKTPQATHDTCMTLNSVCDKFATWCDSYYRRPDGSPTREAVNCEIALRSLRAKYGKKDISDIAYTDIIELRDELISKNLSRTTINQRVGIWKRFYAWAVENRYCNAATKSEVWAVVNLKKNRSPAPEGSPVMPVAHRDVKRTLKYLPPSLQAMVRLQEYTGMRPGEVCNMRTCEVERRRDVWIYRPTHHKTAHKDNVRVIVIGPRAQKVLAPYLHNNSKGVVFSPKLASSERKLNKGHRDNDTWTSSNYGQAIRYAVRAAQKSGEDVHNWTANQLRHACGTRIRRKFGADAAQVVLGHSTGAKITDRYTREAIEAELIKSASRPILTPWLNSFINSSSLTLTFA